MKRGKYTGNSLLSYLLLVRLVPGLADNNLLYGNTNSVTFAHQLQFALQRTIDGLVVLARTEAADE